MFLASVGATRIVSQALFDPSHGIPERNEILADRKSMKSGGNDFSICSLSISRRPGS